MSLQKADLNILIQKGKSCFVIGETQDSNNALSYVCQFIQDHIEREYNNIFIFSDSTLSDINNITSRYNLFNKNTLFTSLKIENIQKYLSDQFDMLDLKANKDYLFYENMFDKKEISLENYKILLDSRKKLLLKEKSRADYSNLSINEYWITYKIHDIIKNNINDLETQKSLLFICAENSHLPIYIDLNLELKFHGCGAYYEIGLINRIEDLYKIECIGLTTSSSNSFSDAFYKSKMSTGQFTEKIWVLKDTV